jgi:agmatine/peptidylarginine deiminase
MAMTLAVKEVLWLSHFLEEISCTSSDLDTVMIYADNQEAITLAKNLEHHARTKHINVQYHFIRKHIKANWIKLSYISTYDMTADSLTKPL